VRLDSVESEQFDRLVAFKASCRNRGLLEEYSDVSEFREKFSRHLQLKLNEDPYFSSEEPPGPLVPFSMAQPAELGQEAKLLLAAAAKGDGIIMRVEHMGGTDVQAGGQNFVESGDRRSAARWEAAVDELERQGLAEDKAGNREVYFITHDGFAVADTLPASS
jgi:hypothetical protein